MMQTLSPYTAVMESGGPGFLRQADICVTIRSIIWTSSLRSPRVPYQPHFANPPNEAQRRALEVEDILEEREAVLDRIDALRRGN